MKKLICLCLLILLGIVGSAQAQYAQLSSSIDQYGEGFITFDQVDGIDGMDYEPYVGVTILDAGLYFTVAAPQTITGKGCYDLWFNVNGADVPNSNVRYCSQGPKQTDVIISQGVACYQVNDVLNLKQSGTGIEAIWPDGEPLIPSIIFTMYRVGDC